MALFEASDRVRQTLRALMKARRVTYSDLAAALGVSTSTVKRLVNNGDMSLGKLESVANALDIDVFELFALAGGADASGVELTEEQERFLARNPLTACYYWLRLSGTATDKIEGLLSLKPGGEAKILAALEANGLASIRRNGKSQLAHEWPLGFRFKGPLHEKYTRTIFTGFIDHLLRRVETVDLSDHKGSLGFSVRLVQFVLNTSAYAELMADIGELLKTYIQRSKRQITLAPGDGETVSFFVGCDRWDAILEAFKDGGRQKS